MVDKMKKIFVFLITFLFLISIAQAGKVYIINFLYDDGKLDFKNKIIKDGYSPDKKIQEGDYRADIIAADGRTLYTFNFDIPSFIYVDVSNSTTGELSGGVVALNKTNFALAMPYFDDAEEVNIYNPRNFRIITVDVEEEKEFLPIKESNLLPLILVIIILIVFSIFFVRKSRKRK